MSGEKRSGVEKESDNKITNFPRFGQKPEFSHAVLGIATQVHVGRCEQRVLKWNIHLAFDGGAVGAVEREHEDGDDYERDFVHVWSAGVDDCCNCSYLVRLSRIEPWQTLSP